MTTVDLRETGGPAGDGSPPPPVPAGVIAIHFGLAMRYDPGRFRFYWRTTGGGLEITAGKEGVGMTGELAGMTSNVVDGYRALLAIANTVAVWMLHGQTPEYVVEFLSVAENSAGG